MTLLFIGTTEIILIGGVALLIFGGKKLPDLMRNMGKGVKEFKKGMSDGAEAFSEERRMPEEGAAEAKDENAASKEEAKEQ